MTTTATTQRPRLVTQNPERQQQQPQTAKEIIAANVKCLIEQLEAGKSHALTAYLDAMSRFHNYSFGNILEIARQKPDAIRVAGFWKWKEFGRSVKKGEKGTASADYIQLYHGNASLLTESLEVVQQTSAVILAALQPPTQEQAEMPDAELAQVA
jgi:hypothetical protein